MAWSRKMICNDWPLLLHAPRAVEHFRVAEVAVAVARDPAVGRAGEDLLVGGDPLDAGVGDRRGSSPGRPSLPRATCPAASAPNSCSWYSTARRICSCGVLRIAVEVLGQLDVGHRPAGQPLVPEQRQDRMVKGRRRQLDLAPLLQLRGAAARPGADTPSACPAATASPAPSSDALLAELGQLGVGLEGQRVEPGQVRPALQIEQVLLAEPSAGPARWIDAEAPLLVQLVVAGDRAGSCWSGLAMKKLSSR